MSPTICYVCSDRSKWRIYDEMQPVCEFHRDEALEEENQPIMVMSEENYQCMLAQRHMIRKVAI